MSTSESFEALRRANPRRKAGFAEAVDLAAAELRARIETAATADQPHGRQLRPRHRLVGVSAAGFALAAAASLSPSSSPSARRASPRASRTRPPP
jgi:hypothetical protein